jgi:hypothetical protein
MTAERVAELGKILGLPIGTDNDERYNAQTFGEWVEVFDGTSTSGEPVVAVRVYDTEERVLGRLRELTK